MMDDERSDTNDSKKSSLQPGEPTVLDWVKSWLRLDPIPIPEEEVIAEPPRPAPISPSRSREQPESMWGNGQPDWSHLRLPIALFIALIAQFTLESVKTSGGCCDTTHYLTIFVCVRLYGLAAVIVMYSMLRGDFRIESLPDEQRSVSGLTCRPMFLVCAAIFSVLTFRESEDNLFRASTMLFWVAALACALIAFWEGDVSFTALLRRLKEKFPKREINITLNKWTFMVLIGFGISLYFRVADLASVPPEMVSDHAEKLLDVADVLSGKLSIFFTRNTGREAMQFYMGAAAVKWLGVDISFMALKIGTVAAGLVTLPYVYLLGKEVGGREVGLAGMVLAGVGYWPNVISRIGLRFPLFPLFVAPAMYYLLRGIRRKRLNDLLLCGLAVGLGLHGYSPARVIPIVIFMGVLLFMFHREARGQRWVYLTWLIIIGIVALIVSLPLLSVALDRPDEIFYRMLTRVGSAEQAIEESPLVIFLKNVLKGLGMFAWDNGDVWVNSIPHRPAMDWVTGTLFQVGLVILFIRYLKYRKWVDLFLIISIPILQLPSTLSIAFPHENPATNRAAGAIVPAFVIAGVALASIPAYFREQWKGLRNGLASTISVSILLLISALTNYQLVFHEYADGYRRAAWYTSEAGEVIKAFAESVGTYDTAYVVAHPHWMDTRLVGINAGQPARDYAIEAEAFDDLLAEPRAMLFILRPVDEDSLAKLQELFPTGTVSWKRFNYEGKDLVIYFVPPDPGREDFQGGD